MFYLYTHICISNIHPRNPGLNGKSSFDNVLAKRVSRFLQISLKNKKSFPKNHEIKKKSPEKENSSCKEKPFLEEKRFLEEKPFLQKNSSPKRKRLPQKNASEQISPV